MRPRTTAILATAALGLAIPASGLAEVSTTIGTGEKTCVLGPGAECRGVVHRWTVEHHGNLRGARFTRADLRGVDFKGADLRKADFRGAKLRHADLRGARLKGARFSALPATRKAPGGRPGRELGFEGSLPGLGCNFSCQGVDLSYANLTGQALMFLDFQSANFSYANLTSTILISATLNNANFTGANLSGANLSGASIAGTDFASATFSNTTCPGGNVTNTGC